MHRILRFQAVTGLVVILAVLIMVPTAAKGDWQGTARTDTLTVHVNFSERLTVTVSNLGSSPIDVLTVAVTIQWSGMPTLYPVFNGTEFLAPGASKAFVSSPTRMPNVVPGTYDCVIGVSASGPDGQVIEHRFQDRISAAEYSLALFGLPEEYTVPLVFALLMIAITAAIFRLERTGPWPNYRAVPRWTVHRSRRR